MPVSVFFSQPVLLQDQEPKRQHDQSHVMVKAAPATNLIVVQPHFLLAPQKTILDGPAVMPGSCHFQQWAVRGRVAQVVLDIGCLITTALDYQPQLRSVEVIV